MIFLESIKQDINPNSIIRGPRPPKGFELVKTSDIRELVRSFERLDSEARAIDAVSRNEDENYQLICLINKMWHSNGKKADDILFLFADELQKLTNEKQKDIPHGKF
jgi:hypothetical protein